MRTPQDPYPAKDCAAGLPDLPATPGAPLSLTDALVAAVGFWHPAPMEQEWLESEVLMLSRKGLVREPVFMNRPFRNPHGAEYP